MNVERRGRQEVIVSYQPGGTAVLIYRNTYNRRCRPHCSYGSITSVTAKIAPLGSDLAPQLPDRLGVPGIRWILDVARIFSHTLFWPGGGTVVRGETAAGAG